MTILSVVNQETLIFL